MGDRPGRAAAGPRSYLMVAPYSGARVDLAADLAIPAIAAQGLSALGPQLIASRAGVSRQAVHLWFGSGERLRTAVAERFTARWTHWCDARVHFHGLPGLLADGEEALLWTRVWLAISEGAAHDPTLAGLLGYGRRVERDLIRSTLRELEDPEPGVPLLQALVEGLRCQLALPPPATTWHEAAALLDSTRATLLATASSRPLA